MSRRQHHEMMKAAARNPQLNWITDYSGTGSAISFVTSAALNETVQNGDILFLMFACDNGQASNESAVTGTWTELFRTDNGGAAWYRQWLTGDPTQYTVTVDPGGAKNYAYALAVYRAPFFISPTTTLSGSVGSIPSYTLNKGQTSIVFAVDDSSSITSAGSTTAGYTVRRILANGTNCEYLYGDVYASARRTMAAASLSTTCSQVGRLVF